MSRWTRSGVIGIARRKTHHKNGGQPADGPLIIQPRDIRSGFVLLDSHAFRNAMNVLIARARSVFSILLIRPEQLGWSLLLGETILNQLRGASGDLVGYMDGAIAVALHGTDHVGAVAFADRLRDTWRRESYGELSIEIAEHPCAEDRVIELLTTDWSSGWNSIVIDDGGGDVGAQALRADGDDMRAGIADRQ
jgi:hypothetical protein